jgi:hypothetical protein
LKLSSFTKVLNLHQSSQLAPKFSTCTKVLNLLQSSQLAPKFSTCTKVLNLHQSSQLAPKFSTCTKVLNLEIDLRTDPRHPRFRRFRELKKMFSRRKNNVDKISNHSKGWFDITPPVRIPNTYASTWWTDWGMFRPFGIVYFG